MMKKISVAMAVFNGEKYIYEQLKSILDNLSEGDEVIVSDDDSTDHTLDIVHDFQDERIKLIKGPGCGVVKNFANAIQACTGDVIFLADQDDVWMPDKVDSVVRCMDESNCTCVIHDAIIADENLSTIQPSYLQYRGIREGNLNNIIKPGYLGCCMAFTAEMKKYIFPIPNHIEMHDRWIGAVCGKFGKNQFLYKSLIYYRRHGDNVSQIRRKSIPKIICNRLYLVGNLLIR